MPELYARVENKTHRNKNPTDTNLVGVGAHGGLEGVPGYTPILYQDRLDGKKNPYHRTQIIRGENACTDMSANSVVFESLEYGYHSVIGYTTQQRLPQYEAKSVKDGLSNVPSSVITTHVAFYTGNAVSHAAGDWYARVRNAMSGFKGSVFAAESREAKRMMCVRANKMLSMIGPFQRRLRKSWVKSRTKRGKLKTLANSWLELQFGWLPLASDIEDLYKALHNPRPMYKRVVAYGNDGYSEPIQYGVAGSGYTSTQMLTWNDYWCQVKYQGLVRVRDSPSGSRLLDFGLGVREFLPTVWEVIPWSFAIDYFTNVSEIVNAISYRSVYVPWVNQTTTMTRTWNRTGRCRVTGNLFYAQTLQDIPMNLRVTRKRVLRYAQVEVPMPTLTFQLPKLKQFVNLAALAVSKRLRLAY